MNKIDKFIKNPKLLWIYILNSKLLRIVPDKIYLGLKYRTLMNSKLNLNNPQTFNEKLQWLKINDRKEFYTSLVDKYLVREYISNRIGSEYLIPLLGVYKKFEEIDFNVLPDKFVLKPNHTSGDIFICENKKNIDYSSLKKMVDGWLKKEYFWIHREWPYKNINPVILCEEYIESNSSYGLIDYKFMCFDGEPKLLFLGLNRGSEKGLNVDFYDFDWNKLPFERYYPSSNDEVSKPENLDRMIALARTLSKGMKFVRVDFYEVNGKVLFGELTFYPGSGFEYFTPSSYDYLLGSYISLY
ncbi:ATP-grasp fold amidoligase family protein [Serpentinicella alkaliphila]|uniref:Teichuronopeptide biosynthesis TupA-like protein n=1 Tax=Serpentinicella alkaliphila TaxID=1734049 RepID=A0A4V2T2U5_9FIRM|nr:ATP-grasp fold amidoligase family protein [Serpentinicella alkaliphila]TCP98403.1 teichuronopeptide biosynthesis TupA-like protein [Serpentinicella alkaliphila]